MSLPAIRLFVKSYCPWCQEAEEWLTQHGVAYETLNVSANPEARKEMRELSGQDYAPVIDVGGEILADFGADELEEWWREKGFHPT